MPMKSVMTCLLCALMAAACGGEVAPEEDDGQTLEEAQEAAQEAAEDESLGTSRQELKWTPLKEPWYSCLVGLQICRCSGHVIDCRNPIPLLPKAPEKATAAP